MQNLYLNYSNWDKSPDPDHHLNIFPFVPDTMKSEIQVRHPTPELLKQEMGDVITEFYKLEKIINNSEQYTQNYIVIRLVTVIEQFFRKIIEYKIKNEKSMRYIPNQVILDKQTFISMEPTSKEALIASSYSFQNFSAIKDGMKTFGINCQALSKNANLKQDVEELFQLRHNIVHTVVSPTIKIEKYYSITECLIHDVLNCAYNSKGMFFFSKGYALNRLNQYRDAITCFDKGLKLDPKNIPAYVNKGVSLGSLNQHDEAIVCFDRALKLDPQNISANRSKGISLASLNQHEEAIACFDKALEIDPQEGFAYVNKGYSLARLSQHETAILYFDFGLALRPDYALAYLNKGISLASLNQHEEAIACFDKALEIDPKEIVLYLNKGVSLDRLNQHEEAIACFDKALEIDPKNSFALASKGLSYGFLGKHMKAIVCSDKALEIDPKNSLAYRGQG